MTQTERYQLNQWEPDDQVKRADFNADNAKVDAALAAKADQAAVAALSAAVAAKADAADLEEVSAALARDKLLEVVTAANQAKVDLVLPAGIDLSQYLELMLYITAWSSKETAPSNETLCMVVNGLTGNNHYTNSGGGDTSIKLGVLPTQYTVDTAGMTWRLHFSMLQNRQFLEGWGAWYGFRQEVNGSYESAFTFGAKLSGGGPALQKLSFFPSDTACRMAAGSSFYLYGIRK